jgi:hypothetical protein
LRADCIRVTHPYDTLGLLLLKILPFVLHVLGLPLAFILSQDQTLHSIVFSINFKIALSINTRLVAQRSFEPSNPQPMSFNPRSSLTFYVLNNIAAIPLKESTRWHPLSSTTGSAINLHSFKERLYHQPS